MKALRLALILPLLFLLPACAVNNVYDYRSAPVVLPVQGSQSVFVAVEDARPYVLSGKKNPDFIGLRRGGYGNPFNVTTASGEPLASDFEAALTMSLQNAGYTVVSKSAASRRLSVTLREWKSDVYSNLKVLFDVQMDVTNADGEVLASSSIQGEEAAGGGAMMEQHNESVRRAFEAKMSLLFSKPDVRAALAD